MPCTLPRSSSSTRRCTTPSIPSCSASAGYCTVRPHASESMSGMLLMYTSDTGRYSGLAGAAGAAGSGVGRPLPDLAGSIIVVFPTGTVNDESPSVVDDMVTPNTGLGGSFGGSLGGSALGGGASGGGGAACLIGITLGRGGGSGGLGGGVSIFGGGGGT